MACPPKLGTVFDLLETHQQCRGRNFGSVEIFGQRRLSSTSSPPRTHSSARPRLDPQGLPRSQRQQPRALPTPLPRRPLEALAPSPPPYFRFSRRRAHSRNGVQLAGPPRLPGQEPSLRRSLRCLLGLPGEESEAGSFQPRDGGEHRQRCVAKDGLGRVLEKKRRPSVGGEDREGMANGRPNRGSARYTPHKLHVYRPPRRDLESLES